MDITQGRLDLEGCDISSQSLACVAIHDGADPRLRRNTIHDGNEAGVFVYDDGLGTLEDNDITANTLAGRGDHRPAATPPCAATQIHDGKEGGVFVCDNGLGTLEDNDITANARRRGDQDRRQPHPAPQPDQPQRVPGGRWIDQGGRGVLEDNDLTGNAPGMGHRRGLREERDPRPQQGMISSITEASDQRHGSAIVLRPANPG